MIKQSLYESVHNIGILNIKNMNTVIIISKFMIKTIIASLVIKSLLDLHKNYLKLKLIMLNKLLNHLVEEIMI